MGTLTRKQREIAEREDLILSVARQLMVDQGYLGLTMDKVAAEIEYSKGTIYQHFSCKEEILAGLAYESAELRRELFERAATFRGRPRERLAGVGVADHLLVNLYPQHFAIERLIHTHSIRDKLSEKRLAQLEACNEGCKNVITGLVRDGAAQGDIEYDDPQTPALIAFGLWSMAFGANLIAAAGSVDLEEKLGIADHSEVLFQNYHRLLDGYGWQPLSTEWDYHATVQRVQEEVFPDEVRRLSAS